MPATAIAIFDPVLYNIEENTWLMLHLGESMQLATRSGVPVGVGRTAIQTLDELYRLEQECQVHGETWIGFEACKAQSAIYLDQLQKWEADYQRKVKRDPNYPRYPSMCGWDSLGRYHYGAAGSDAGRVRTYFDETGARQKFERELQPVADDGFIPEQLRGKVKPSVYTQLIEKVTEETGYVECPICQERHTFDPQSRSKRNAAMARMGKHCTKARVEPDLHKQLHAAVFGSH